MVRIALAYTATCDTCGRAATPATTEQGAVRTAMLGDKWKRDGKALKCRVCIANTEAFHGCI